MATKIVMEFTTSAGNKKISLNYGDPNATSSQVKTVMQAIVTNGALFSPQYTGIVSAYAQTTTQDDFDLS